MIFAIAVVVLADAAAAFIFMTMMSWPGDDPATHPFKAIFTTLFALACCVALAAALWARPNIALRLLLGSAPALTIVGLVVYGLVLGGSGLWP
jgi:hypothetical protein